MRLCRPLRPPSIYFENSSNYNAIKLANLIEHSFGNDNGRFISWHKKGGF